MSDLMAWLDGIDARASAATEGPWERGDRQHIAGVLPEKFGEGRCTYCHMGDPSWTGRMSINGTRMLAHVHDAAEPWWEHGIRAYRPDGSEVVVNDTGEYGYVTDLNADFIAHSRTDVPSLVAALRAVLDLADWHETKAEKARHFPGAGNEATMEKAAQVHDDAARRIRTTISALIPGGTDETEAGR